MGLNIRGQMKIQQMAFMIVAVFIFFVLVGLFFLNFQIKDLKGSVRDLNREKAISSLEVIANMPELNCGSRKSLCLDEDKIKIMASISGTDYKDIWPVASIEVYKVYPSFSSVIECPATDCNYYNLFDSGQKNKEKYSTYVSLCKRVSELEYVYDSCEIAKLVVGMEIYEE